MARKMPDDMAPGTRHKTNSFGVIEILKYTSAKEILVKFVGTGFKTTCQAVNVREGRLKDLLQPSMLGVGFTGDGNFKPSIGGVETECHMHWRAMIHRCYNEKFKAKNPAYNDCKVCDEWHNFQEFAKWYQENHPDDGGKYHLDKDIKIKGNKTYSPEACKFVTPAENSEQATAKRYKFTSPTGEVVDVYNLSKFCRDNDICVSHMCNVNNGNLDQHKGWTRHKE
ncbi:HNH endonuclease [Vibrio phage D85]